MTDLALTLVNAYVSAIDPESWVNANMRNEVTPLYADLTALLEQRTAEDPATRCLLDRVAEDPANLTLLGLLQTRLATDRYSNDSSLYQAVRTLARADYSRHVWWAAGSHDDPEGRIHGCHTTYMHISDALGRTAIGRAADRAPLAVIIPIRISSERDTRMRNLFAAVAAICAQSLTRWAYRVIVVEQDAQPRCGAIAKYIDDYIFVTNDGPYNRSWALNVGERLAGGARLLCLLDADAFVPYDFLERLNEDLSQHDVVLPFDEVLYLDHPSADALVRTLHETPAGAPHPALPPSGRGYALRGVKGFCLGLTRELFDAVDGFDERYEGWGDEDNEFYQTLRSVTTISRRDGYLAHLWHPRPPMIDRKGRRPNESLVGVARPSPRQDRGRVDKYTSHEHLAEIPWAGTSGHPHGEGAY
jgi:hypothetical protein